MVIIALFVLLLHIISFNSNVHFHNSIYIHSSCQFSWVIQYTNQYGSHPFYTQILNDGSGAAHGVYLKNSNGMEINFMNQERLEFHVLGGILDWYIFTGVCYCNCFRLRFVMLNIPQLRQSIRICTCFY
jgi:hypothetical protein